MHMKVLHSQEHDDRKTKKRGKPMQLRTAGLGGVWSNMSDDAPWSMHDGAFESPGRRRCIHVAPRSESRCASYSKGCGKIKPAGVAKREPTGAGAGCRLDCHRALRMQRSSSHQ